MRLLITLLILLGISGNANSQSKVEDWQKKLQPYSYSQGNLCKMVSESRKFNSNKEPIVGSYKFPFFSYLLDGMLDNIFSSIDGYKSIDFGDGVYRKDLGQGYHMIQYSKSAPKPGEMTYLIIYYGELNRESTEVCIADASN